jgi:CBS domain containing-hemolysin-like protein
MDLLKIAFVVFLVLLNGFFVATEFAVVKVRSTQLRVLARKGSRRARLAEKVTNNLTAILSACQLGITLATIGLGWAGEKWVTEILFLPLLHALGMAWVSERVVHSVAFFSAYVVISAVHIIVGEQAPKGLAIQRAEETTLWVAAPIQAFYLVFFPFVWLLNSLSNLVLRAVGVAPATGDEVGHGEEELRLVFARSRRSGFLTADEQRLMENVLNMTQKTARQVMDPRTSIVFLSTQKPLRENLWIARESGHTRFPLCDGDLDHVLGMVHIKDLFEARESGPLSPDFHEVRREVLFFPEGATLDRILRDFQRRRIHLAIVVDEYGATVGMITLENVLEELVGEIQDEFDRETPPIVTIRPGQYRIDGLCPVEAFRRVFAIEPSETDATTVGGLVFDLLGHLPERGESATRGEDRFVVESVKGQRIVSLRFITPRPARWAGVSGEPDSTAEEMPAGQE